MTQWNRKRIDTFIPPNDHHNPQQDNLLTIFLHQEIYQLCLCMVAYKIHNWVGHSDSVVWKKDTNLGIKKEEGQRVGNMKVNKVKSRGKCKYTLSYRGLQSNLKETRDFKVRKFQILVKFFFYLRNSNFSTVLIWVLINKVWTV